MTLPCGCTWQATPDDRHGPIFWNPYNQAAQCHKCGELYVPRSVLVARLNELARSRQHWERPDGDQALSAIISEILQHDHPCPHPAVP